MRPELSSLGPYSKKSRSWGGKMSRQSEGGDSARRLPAMPPRWVLPVFLRRCKWKIATRSLAKRKRAEADRYDRDIDMPRQTGRAQRESTLALQRRKRQQMNSRSGRQWLAQKQGWVLMTRLAPRAPRVLAGFGTCRRVIRTRDEAYRESKRASAGHCHWETAAGELWRVRVKQVKPIALAKLDSAFSGASTLLPR